MSKSPSLPPELMPVPEEKFPNATPEVPYPDIIEGADFRIGENVHMLDVVADPTTTNRRMMELKPGRTRFVSAEGPIACVFHRDKIEFWPMPLIFRDRELATKTAALWNKNQDRIEECQAMIRASK